MDDEGLLPVSNDDPIYSCELDDEERDLLKRRFLGAKCRGGTICAAPNCKNSKNKNPTLSFHRFPKDLKRCKKWMIFSRRDYRNRTPADISGKWAFCENHFENSQYMDPTVKGSEKKWKKLIPNALPTIFDVDNPPKPVSIKRKLPTRHPLPKKRKKTCTSVYSNDSFDERLQIITDEESENPSQIADILRNESSTSETQRLTFRDVPKTIHTSSSSISGSSIASPVSGIDTLMDPFRVTSNCHITSLERRQVDRDDISPFCLYLNEKMKKLSLRDQTELEFLIITFLLEVEEKNFNVRKT